MDFFRRYRNLLKADGANQLQRLLPALEPGYIVPDERSLADLVEYARRLAAEIRFYDLTGQATGDWRPFLEPLIDPATGRVPPTPELEAALAARGDWPPHLVLFLVFLKLFGHLQGDLNELPEKHLRHYFEKELGLRRRDAAGDEVHVIFELARNAAPTLLPAGTLLDAGKDEKGRPLSYATQAELSVSAAAVGGIRRLVVERDRRRNRRFFVAAAIAESEGPSWYTFGRRQLDLDPSQRFMAEAALGFAVASPVLRLAEGERTVSFLAHLRTPGPRQPPATQGIGYALDVALTGAEGWLVPDSVQANLLEDGGNGQPALSMVLTLGRAAAAIVPFNSALHGPGPVSDRPLLRCLIKGETGIYEVLDDLVVEKAEIEVTVKGVRDLVVQNADGPLNVNQPMSPFGSLPQIGAPFYIGSAEVFGKKLSSLDLHLEWKSPPPDLYDHYRAYFDVEDTLGDSFHSFFLADLDLLYDRSFHPLLINQALFAPIATDPKTISAVANAFDSALAGRAYLAQPDLEPLNSYGTGSKFGFVRLVLRSPTRNDLQSYTSVPFEAFGHSAFARRYAQMAIALSKTPPDPKAKLPNEPYTPVLAGLSLDYRATAALAPGDSHTAEAFFIYGPFGATRASDEAPARLAPEIEGEASLFLGIEQLRPPANLSLLFQIDVGTSSAPEVLKAGETEWSCLSNGSWRVLSRSAVLNDSTQGFQKPGLVAISVPREASIEHEALPSGLVWLRALIRRPPESAARTLALKAQAVLAKFQPGASALADYETHLQAGLPAGAIARLQRRNAAIKRVQQPYPSFEGRNAEGDVDFFRRCSERLRHRHRAVTAWDLERLVLEAFPEVFKVKCLPHADATGSAKAGHTALVIVPDLRRTGGSNPLEPRAGEVLMGRIRDFLASGLTSSFANVHVIHPVYERIRVEARVAFRAGRDPGYYTGILNDDLRRFLSPWAYQEGEDILFGARIYRSDILAFMEDRDYVDYLTDFKLYHSFAGQRPDGLGWMTVGADFIIRPDPRPAIADMRIGDDLVVGRGVEVAETTQAHAILVSHLEHLITPITAGEDPCIGVTQLGIGYLTVGLDFRVRPELA